MVVPSKLSYVQVVRCPDIGTRYWVPYSNTKDNSGSLCQIHQPPWQGSLAVVLFVCLFFKNNPLGLDKPGVSKPRSCVSNCITSVGVEEGR